MPLPCIACKHFLNNRKIILCFQAPSERKAGSSELTQQLAAALQANKQLQEEIAECKAAAGQAVTCVLSSQEGKPSGAARQDGGGFEHTSTSLWKPAWLLVADLLTVACSLVSLHCWLAYYM